MDNITFINNTALRNGGAIFWNGNNGTIKNSRFTNNRATGENKEYSLTLDMGDKIEVGANGTLTLGNIIVLQQNHMPCLSFCCFHLDNIFLMYRGHPPCLDYHTFLNLPIVY